MLLFIPSVIRLNVVAFNGYHFLLCFGLLFAKMKEYCSSHNYMKDVSKHI
jgi:hypothetical protein